MKSLNEFFCFRRHHVVKMFKYSLTAPLNKEKNSPLPLYKHMLFHSFDLYRSQILIVFDKYIFPTGYLEWYIQLDVQLTYNVCKRSSKQHSPILHYFHVYITKRSLNFHSSCQSISEPGSYF